jgi:outer membrane protein OmpA-like peptidoglycan-associated protein
VLEYDEYEIAVETKPDGGMATRMLAGKTTRIQYRNPAQRSALEIYRNYESAFKKAGAKIVYSCSAADCSRWPTRSTQRMLIQGPTAEMRGLVAQYQFEGRETWAVFLVGRYNHWLHVIERKAMEADKVEVDAEALGAGLDRDGHISVYAIYFDTGKATLKPESKPTLEQIAKLLLSRPRLKLRVVGHTDSTGALAANMKLSADRAAAVVSALASAHGVAAARLESHGVGPLAPVATNRTEDGRAKNRRVDLVEQ